MESTSAFEFEWYEVPAGQAFPEHSHDKHQLAWVSAGVMSVDADGRRWALPHNVALWVPAEMPHAVRVEQESVFLGIYIHPCASPVEWHEPTVVAVSPLVRHLIEHLANELPPDARARAEAVLADALSPAHDAALVDLPMPADARALALAETLLSAPADGRSLAELAAAVHSSPRTLLRIFLAETGMTFSQWRLHARVRASMALLVDGHSVARVADRIGYATPSAFVAAFRRVTGSTPSAYAERTRTAGLTPLAPPAGALIEAVGA